MVVDEDRITVSAGLIQRLEGGRQFRGVRQVSSDRGVDQALLEREVTAVIHIPRRFEQDLVHSAILSSYARERDRTLPTRVTMSGTLPTSPLDLRTQRWFNLTRNYKQFMQPS
jgi:hypothetical protein